jgi:hypothetical protein
MSTRNLRLLMVMVAFSLITGVSAAFAAHLDVTLKSPVGTTVTSTTPYSPKMTCGGCHFNCADSTYSNDKSTWCGAPGMGSQKDCSVPGNCPDYESAATTNVSKVQGYPQADGSTAFTTYDVKAPMHGASTGKHSSEGRNEGLTTAQRTIWSAPATISGPGMYGRY